MARERISVRVTYDVVTEASVVDGDTADGGFIDPRTERRRSLKRGGHREHDRTLKASRSGKLDWSLRAAIEFIDGRSCAGHESDWQRSDDRMSIDARDEYQGCDIERMGGSRVVSINYTLFIDGVSFGTLDRIARLLQGRVYFANVPELNRRKVA